MENLVPPVVAVIVTCDPGEWFEETLRAFAAQDYPELSVLVLDAGSEEDPTPRVAAALPGAYVRRLAENPGFGPTVNQVLDMVQGASHLLVCHDDVAPDPDVVHILVEESFRSNAGVVAPKLVAWDDERRLLHVGMAVDKGGAVVDRVDPLEIDHGQHDAVQDVFLAPGGCTLVRADLFAELGGYDPGIALMGEDLDLCWRAQIAGARVVVAPGARVRHLERLASGHRAVPASPSSPSADPHAKSRRLARPTLQALQRRHELRAVLSAYGPFHLVRVLPQLVVLATAETVVALLAGHRDRAAAVAGAWRWNWARRGELRSRRALVRAHRQLSDANVRRLQLHGSARLTAYVRRAVTHGLEVAHIGGEAEILEIDLPEETDQRPTKVFGFPLHPLVLLLAGLVVLIGSRQLLGLGLPYVGGFLPMPSAGELIHRFVAAWQPSGVGSTDPTSPATGILGAAAYVLGGSTGLLQKVLVLGSLPVGALGVSRLVRPFGSAWARVASTVAYLAVPVAYDAIATGRFDALVAYAAAPWIAARLARASGVAPFIATSSAPHHGARRAGLLSQALGLGIVDALACSLAPATGALVLVMTAALALAVVVTGLGARGSEDRGGVAVGAAAGRVVAVGAGATLVAVVLLAPWSIAVLSGPLRWQVLTGVPLDPASGPSWAQTLRLSIGPIGDTPLSYGMLGAAALPLLIGARRRLVWAGYAWVLTVAAFGLAWAEGRGWTGGLALDPQILLVPAAVGVALAIGLGAAAFERDLPSYRFGWRQGAVVLAAAAAAVGSLPVLVAAGSGRWDLPHIGYGEATTFMAARSPHGGFRVLWLADPRVLPGAGWSLLDGTAYALSGGGVPDATAVWATSDPGPATAVGQAVGEAQRGQTVRLGALLAPYAVRYVVLVDALAPVIPGYQVPQSHPSPPSLLAALETQSDLRQVVGQDGMHVFADDLAVPEFSRREAPLTPQAAATPGVTAATGLTGWVPVGNPRPSATALPERVPAGTLLLARAPPRAWEARGSRGVIPSGTAFGYAPRFDVPSPGGAVVVQARGSWVHGLEITAEVLLWVVVSLALIGRRRWLGTKVARHGRRGVVTVPPATPHLVAAGSESA